MAPRPAHSSGAANPRLVAKASSAPAASLQFPASLAAAVERCWRRAAAPADWDLTPAEFQEALERSVAQRFSGAPLDSGSNARAIESYLDTLHASDLALARACSAGHAAAWEFFIAQFRQELYRAARAIVTGSGSGDSGSRELADSLYADLCGLRESEGRRKSLFDYFHGRSKLGTWLRALLAQRHVDEIRRARRTEPLENEEGEERGEIAAAATRISDPAENAPPDPDRATYLGMVQAALAVALLLAGAAASFLI